MSCRRVTQCQTLHPDLYICSEYPKHCKSDPFIKLVDSKQSPEQQQDSNNRFQDSGSSCHPSQKSRSFEAVNMPPGLGSSFADRTETSQRDRDSTPYHCFREQLELLLDADVVAAVVVVADVAAVNVLRLQVAPPILALDALDILLVACKPASLDNSILAESIDRSRVERNLEAAVGMAERESHVLEYWTKGCRSGLDKDRRPDSSLLAVPRTPCLIRSCVEVADSRMAADFVVEEHVMTELPESLSHSRIWSFVAWVDAWSKHRGSARLRVSVATDKTGEHARKQW